jgi:hypothetical protein
MKLLQHGLDFVRRVYRHIDAGRKSSPAASENDGRNFPALLQLLHHLQQLVHHLEVDDVERRMGERDLG